MKKGLLAMLSLCTCCFLSNTFATPKADNNYSRTYSVATLQTVSVPAQVRNFKILDARTGKSANKLFSWTRKNGEIRFTYIGEESRRYEIFSGNELIATILTGRLAESESNDSKSKLNNSNVSFVKDKDGIAHVIKR